MQISNLKRQHKEVLELIKGLFILLKNGEFSEHTIKDIHKLLFKLAGKLNVHLSMEDAVVYPQLLNDEKENIRKAAKRIFDENGKQKKLFNEYLQKWYTVVSIQANSSEFSEETRKILDKISSRIDKEDNELFPLIDSSV